MKQTFKTLLAVSSLCACLAQAGYAQSTGEDEGDMSDSYGPFDSDVGGGHADNAPLAEPNVTSLAQITTQLSDAGSLCGNGAYAVDCLAERLETLTKDMRGLREYDDVRVILEDTAKDLRQIATDNRDPDVPSARLARPDLDLRSNRPLVPVAPAKQAQAIAAAIDVLEEAETKLLRSASQSVARSNQYQKIAAALGSNKVLLRSL